MTDGRRGDATLASRWRAVSGGDIDDALLAWPPDVFALTDVLLEAAEIYRFVVSPPPGRTWPPAPGWADDVAAAAGRWLVHAREGETPVPRLVADAWAVLRDAAATDLDAVADGAHWEVGEALLTLHAVADEACAGMGVAVTDRPPPGSALRGRGREILTRTGTLARAGRSGLRVLPKVRTPDGGISLRSLARYVCVRNAAVGAQWHRIPLRRPGGDPRRQAANLLLLPWPLHLNASAFRPDPDSVRRTDREPFGFFTYHPAERLDLDLVDRLLAAAREEVDGVDVVVLPESAAPADAVDGLEAVLARHHVGALVTGVRDGDVAPGRQPGNWVHIGVRLGDRWWHYRQNKHHRWSLDESQVLQYQLGGVLHPGVRWWEAMEVPRRSVQFVEIGGGVTVVAVICEDLARLDAVADLLRTVGPTLVVTVLLDGPQLASRWTARYAGVLADDPGSAVLTLTSFGMVERSRPAGRPPSRVVALWKDPERGTREISLEPGADAVLLSAAVDRGARHSADGRPPADDATHLRDVGVHQVRARPPGAAPTGPTDLASPPAPGALGLDEHDLTVLSSWAEALAEAGGDEHERQAVLADAVGDTGWRAAFGVPAPSPALGHALALLAVAAGPTGPAAAAADDPVGPLVERVWAAASGRQRAG